MSRAITDKFFMGTLGAPFMLQGDEDQPKMNKPRAVEGLVITVVGALLSAITMGFVGYMWLVPEIMRDNALLEQALSNHAKHLEEHELEAMQHRREDQQTWRYAVARIEASLRKIEDKLEKHDNDFYRPFNGG